MKRNLFWVMLVCALAFVRPAEAAIPKNALGAIAISPDGKTLLAAGDNRVLYVIDAASLAVQKRIWLGVNPLEIHYSADGSSFALHDTNSTLKFFNASTYKKTSEVSDVELIAVAEKADVIVTAGRSRGRDRDAKTPLRAYALATGQPVVDKTANGSILGLGVAPDMRLIYAISRRIKSDTEPVQKVPTGMRGMEYELFKQKNDGYVSDFMAFDGQGNEVGRHTSWYSVTQGSLMLPIGNTLRVVNYGKFFADITLGSMDTKLAESKNSYNYGIGYSLNVNRLATGGLRNGTIVHLDSGQTQSFQLNRISGWPEYFKGFAIAGDGTVYGVTTAYRLVKVDTNAGTRTVPIY